MKTYTAAELKEILRKHYNWWYGLPEGCRANLCGADLRDADLCDANLRRANLCGADLRRADLRDADLRDADLCDADLRGADLRRADLRGANLCGADLRDANYNERTAFYALQCPEAGSFIGWKKASHQIVKLEITEDAVRSSATTRKCRCSKAKVLAIENLDGSESKFTAVPSDRDHTFVYEVGKTVQVEDFDTNRWSECAPGIHFFITRDEAVRY